MFRKIKHTNGLREIYLGKLRICKNGGGGGFHILTFS